jgi:hypothetical protein
MKTGDKVIRKWKPAYGEGQIMHILGESVVVKWTHTGMPTVNIEDKKYLKVINEMDS